MRTRVFGLALFLTGCGATGGEPSLGPSLEAGTPIEAHADATAEETAIERTDSAPPFTGETGTDAKSPAKCALGAPGSASSKWAAIEADGTLSYAKLETGEQLLDFSWAGYHGGGVALPSAPVKQTVEPSGDDDTKAIQAAIDVVSKLPLEGGLRGAVLLAPGTFRVSGTLTLGASGVVVRGSGASSTTLAFVGTPRDAIVIAGTGSWSPKGTRARITDAYVPAGTRTFHVEDSSGLSVGDAVLVDRTVTTEWIHFMGMDTLVRDGAKETWLADGTVIHSDRTITAITGKEITIDAPLSDSFDAKYASASVVRYDFAGRIENVGLESLRLTAPKNAAAITIDAPIWRAVRMDAVLDGWVEDVVTEEFTSGLIVDDGAKWITIQDVEIARTNPIDGSSGWPFHLSVAGQQTLVQRVKTFGDDAFPYATQARTPGPNVLLGLVAKGTRAQVQPHQRWATGLLVDSSTSETIDLRNRGIMGSGHGWTIGFSVVWNSTASSFLIQRPPGTQNWGIGLTGTIATAPAPGSTSPILATGTIDSLGKPVAPKSLYLAQLCLRLGPDALKNIGY